MTCSFGRPGAALGQASSAPLIFAGSGTNLPITRRLVDAFMRKHPEVKIEVPPSIGSTGGIRAAADGAITIALTSRPFRESEQGLGLVIGPYARTALVLVAHPSVPDDALSFQDLVRIYRGQKATWADGRTIVVLTRELGESSIDVLFDTVPGFKAAYLESFRDRLWTVLASDQEMNRAVVRIPGSLGLSDMGAIVSERLPVKVLKVNGIAPTTANVADGRYPLVKTLCFVYRERNLPPAAKAFLGFVQSGEGAKVLKAQGYLSHK
jgi:phosphate transport system substrate-binding protein